MDKQNIKIDDILKTFKLFKPEQAINFLAKQYKMEPSEFFAKKFLKIAAYAVKNGIVKTGDLAKSTKDLMKKNIDDNTEIDYDNLEIDPDTIKIKTLFGGKDNKVLIDFINNFAEEMKDIDKDIEKVQKTVITDAKKRGVTISDKELDKNGEAISGTIYDKTNKDLQGKKLKEKINNNIKNEEQLEKAKQEVDKALTKALKTKNTTKKTTTKKTVNKSATKKTDTTKKTANKSTTKKTTNVNKESLMFISKNFINEDINNGATADEDAIGTAADNAKLEDSEMGRLIKRRLEAEATLKASEMGDEYEELKKISSQLSRIRGPRDAKKAEELLNKFTELREKVKDHLDMNPNPDVFEFSGSMSENPEDVILYQSLLDAEKRYRRAIKLANWDGPKEVMPKQISMNNTTENIENQLPEEAKPKKRSGLFNGALGWAIVGAKVTGYVLNHGKDVINAFGNQALRFKEDKGVIAQMTFIVSNGKNSDTKFQDTKFSVRFDINDLKWHATNLDNRKMKFDEQKIIEKALNSNEGKNFKQKTINRWKKLLKGTTKNGKTLFMYLIDNAAQFKLDKDKKLLDTLKKMYINFDKIEQKFA